ncbi:MAG: Ig-like domain-containing protein [Actinomycetota bacterium]
MAVIRVGTTRTRNPVPHRPAALALAIAVSLLAAGCTSDSKHSATVARASAEAIAAGSSAPAKAGVPAAAPGKAPTAKPAKPKPVSQAAVAVLVGNQPAAAGRVGVKLNAAVLVSATGGHLTSVTMTTGKFAITGSFSAGSTSWTAASPLAPSSAYTVKAQAVDPAGVPTTRTVRFTTLTPVAMLRTRIAPLNGETVGVGMPVIIYFNHAVKDRAAVERRLQVTTANGAIGGWYWMNAKEVHFRPPGYWTTGDTVHVDVDLDGVDAGNGLWGAQSRSIEFHIGRSHVALVSAATHTMTVKEDGTVVRKFNVSTGRDAFPTSSGVHVVMSKDKVYWMDSATIGIPRDAPGGYYKQVLSSVRISNSGEFVHAAPWSTKDQGLRNVSHGCVNASVVDAAWFLRFSNRGDVVKVVGTPRKLQLGNGFADWNVSWHDWVNGSALYTP